MDSQTLVIILSSLSTIFTSLALISNIWYSYNRIKLEKEKKAWREAHPFPRFPEGRIVKAVSTRKGVLIDFEEES